MLSSKDDKQMDKRSEIFAFVKETTQLGQERGLVDRSKATKKVSERTQGSYDKTASTRIDLNQKDCGRLMDGVSARSWHTIRASLLHVISQKYMAARKACDELQKRGDWDGAAKEAIIARRAITAHDKVEASERPELKTPRATKRRTLPRSDDWQAIVYEAASEVQKEAIAVMWASGARPDEIERGVEVKWVEKNDANSGARYLMVTIQGAKLTETSGQETRGIVIDPSSAAGQILAAHVGDYDSIIVERGAKRLNKDFEAIRDKTGFKTSPYSLRHQFSANLKAEFGPDRADEVAKAMGHATSRSQGRYGSPRQAQSGKTGVVMVGASRPVKETRSSPKYSGPKTGSPLSDRPG
jgi:integrase